MKRDLSDQGEMTRINILVSKDYHKKVKRRALDEGITITELLCKAVDKYFKTEKK